MSVRLFQTCFVFVASAWRQRGGREWLTPCSLLRFLNLEHPAAVNKLDYIRASLLFCFPLCLLDRLFAISC